MQYKLLNEIPTLYHSTTSERSRDAILREGLKMDNLGMVYLSEQPIDSPNFPYTFLVRIPDQEYLADWREIWYDDGEPVDGDHEYDANNPYYIYLADIPPKYIEEV